MMVNGTIATKRTPVIRTIGISFALGVLLVLGAASTHADTTQSASPTDSTLGPVEGLRVHGRWTIEVRDPDGTLVEHREFENALQLPLGATFLANILGRVASVGGWMIQLHPSGGAGICDDGGGNPINCDVVESTNLQSTTNTFKTLTVSVSASTPAETVLSGSAVAQRDGDIGIVQTFNLFCGSAVSPASCPNEVTFTFTDLTVTTLATPVAVLNGQQVQVNVVISFS